MKREAGVSKKILIINYYWPPSGGPAVQRWLDFSNRLASDAYEVHVLTIEESSATFVSVDRSLLDKIHPKIQIHFAKSNDLFGFYKKYIGKGRVPSNALADEPHPTIAQKLARFVRGNFILPDPRKGWNSFAYKKATEIIEKYTINTVITAGPPHSTHLIGLKIKKSYHLNWIADFHDYWTDVFYLKKFYRTKLAHYFDARMEKKVLQTADAITTHCEYSKTLYSQKLNEADVSKVSVLRMGYEDEYFLNYKPNDNQDKFVITYTGTLPDYYDSNVFFIALNDVLKKYPNLPVVIQMIGSISDTVLSLIESLDLGAMTKFMGYVPHGQSISYIKNSSLLLLVNPNLENDLGIVPGKIYEYLATKNSILSISSHGSENEYLLDQLHAGRNFERNEKTEMISYLDTLIQIWLREKNLIFDKSDSKIPYSRTEEYGKLRGLLDYKLIKNHI